MKTILFATIMLAACIAAKAQFTQPGQKVIGGSFGFNSGNNLSTGQPGYESKGDNFFVSANAGKFMKKNVLTSVAVSYSNNSAKHISPTNTSNNNSNSVNVSFGKTYFKEIAKKIYVGLGGFVSMGYGNSVIKNTQSTDRSESEGYNIGFSIEPNMSYQLTDRFLLTVAPSANFLNLNYSYSKISYTQAGQPGSTGKSQNVNLNTGFFGSPLSNITVGFRYLLKQK